MQGMRKFFVMFAVVASLILVAIGFVQFYPYIFAIDIEGKIEKVERVDLEVSLIQNNTTDSKLNPQLFSFAVTIKSADGQIWPASAEDRQWAAISPGVCVKARYFPYPPWRLNKSGTYYGARLLKAWECK